MEPQNLRFGGGATETILHPLSAVWMLVAIALILALPRKNVGVAFLTAAFTIPVGQVVVLGGLHFTVLRILIIAGLVRMTALGARKLPGGFNGIDQVIVLWSISALTILSLQWMRMDSFIHNLGEFLDAFGGYLVVRSFIVDRETIRRVFKALTVVCVVQGAGMLTEQIAHVNVFGYLGGSWKEISIRDGSIRSQGVMGNIHAGVFGGAVIPLFLWLWAEGRAKFSASIGLIGAMAMVITSSASTSWMSFGGALIGLAFWPLRKQMRLVRWILVSGLMGLHLVMHAPVWALIARVDLTGSSSSYHRYALLDNCIRHFSDWWLLGYKYYNQWGWGMWDLCNQFVVAALTGGLLTLALYIAIFKRSFGAIGTARKRITGDRKFEWLLWCLGSSLFANVVAHFGINYMAMMMMTLLPLFAAISVVSFEAERAQLAAAEVKPPHEVFRSSEELSFLNA